MQPFGDVDILSFVRMGRLNWIGHVNRMDRERKVSKIFNNNPQRSRLSGRPKKNLEEMCTNNYAKLQVRKRCQIRELTGGSPLRRRGSALDCSAVEEEAEGEKYG